MQKPQTSTSGKWEAEYATGGIPSSVRLAPSGSVVEFATYASSMGVVAGTALDIGCGSGRNALYLAELGFDVVAMDFAETQILLLQQMLVTKNFDKKVEALVHDVRLPWPVDAQKASLGVDAFCFKHQIAEDDIKAYVQEATKAFRPAGMLMLSFAGRNDGYYSLFPDPCQSGPGVSITDPGNGIASRLYDVWEVVDMFREFEVKHYFNKKLFNTMHGNNYERETIVLFLEKVN